MNKNELVRMMINDAANQISDMDPVDVDESLIENVFMLLAPIVSASMLNNNRSVPFSELIARGERCGQDVKKVIDAYCGINSGILSEVENVLDK